VDTVTVKTTENAGIAEHLGGPLVSGIPEAYTG
jgi:hypothetical protein